LKKKLSYRRPFVFSYTRFIFAKELYCVLWVSPQGASRCVSVKILGSDRPGDGLSRDALLA
jgi:hypothetical protein